MGTTTAPRNKHPRNATIHSGEFSPQSRTESPFPMFRTSNSRATRFACAPICPYVQLCVRNPRRYRTAGSEPSAAYSETNSIRDCRLILAMDLTETRAFASPTQEGEIEIYSPFDKLQPSWGTRKKRSLSEPVSLA